MSPQPTKSNAAPVMANLDSEQKLMRLQQAMVLMRWVVVGVLWLVTIPWVSWAWREDIQLMQDYFTWAALRSAIAYHVWATLGLSLCIGMTASVLVWQSRNILFGLPQREKYRLQSLLDKIEHTGQRHPLWRWVYRGQS